MAAAGAAAGVGKKLALGAVGAFSGVGAAVAYKLDQSVKVRVVTIINLLTYPHIIKVCKLCFPSLVVFTIGENDDFRKKAKFTHFTLTIAG